MNQFISTIFIASLAFSAYSAIADDKSNTEHAKDGLTQDQEHGHMSSKMMDTNGDGMVSRDEYMNHHESMYGKMPQNENGGVSYKNSMNNKPIGTTTGVSKNGSVDVTKEGPGDGVTYGTN